MKSQIYVLLIIFLGSAGISQPKLSLDLGLGFYQPTLTGFDESVVTFPSKSFTNRNLMLNWGIYYEFFNNARLGYSSFISYDGTNKLKVQLVETDAEASFRRIIQYRFFPIETFFRWKPRIELNFTLSPIWGKSQISLETDSADQLEFWESFMDSFGEGASLGTLKSTETMTSNWFGYSSILGFRYYITSRIAVDLKSGFMNHYYDEKKWRLNGQRVTGPKMKINDLPIFSLKFIYAIR